MFSCSLAALAAFLFFASAVPAGADDLLTHCIGCDLHARDLRNHDFHGATLIGADMHAADLRNADLHAAKLVGADLAGARLDGSDLRDASFTGTDFGAATFAGVRADGVKMVGADFKHVQFTGVDTHALLANCIGCDFTDTGLQGADLRDAMLIGSDFHNADLENANFSGATLCISNRHPQCSDFRGARVTGADLRNVRWCERTDSNCRTATADELRTYGHSSLTGALLP